MDSFTVIGMFLDLWGSAFWTRKPENAFAGRALKLEMNEAGKDLISAVNQGYLHGPCGSTTVTPPNLA